MGLFDSKPGIVGVVTSLVLDIGVDVLDYKSILEQILQLWIIFRCRLFQILLIFEVEICS